jgi:hypothetical protein
MQQGGAGDVRLDLGVDPMNNIIKFKNHESKSEIVPQLMIYTTILVSLHTVITNELYLSF